MIAILLGALLAYLAVSLAVTAVCVLVLLAEFEPWAWLKDVLPRGLTT